MAVISQMAAVADITANMQPWSRLNLCRLSLYVRHLHITAKMPFPNSGHYRRVPLYYQRHCPWVEYSENNKWKRNWSGSRKTGSSSSISKSSSVSHFLTLNLLASVLNWTGNLTTWKPHCAHNSHWWYDYRYISDGFSNSLFVTSNCTNIFSPLLLTVQTWMFDLQTATS